MEIWLLANQLPPTQPPHQLLLGVIGDLVVVVVSVAADDFEGGWARNHLDESVGILRLVVGGGICWIVLEFEYMMIEKHSLLYHILVLCSIIYLCFL